MQLSSRLAALKSDSARRDMQRVLDVMHGWRSLRARFGAHLDQQPNLLVFLTDGEKDIALIREHAPSILSQVRGLAKLQAEPASATPAELKQRTKGMAVSRVSEAVSVATSLRDSPALRAELTKQR